MPNLVKEVRSKFNSKYNSLTLSNGRNRLRISMEYVKGIRND